MSLNLYLGRVATDATLTASSQSVTSTSVHFTAADIGRGVDILGAGADGGTLTATITAVAGNVATISYPSRKDMTWATVTVYVPYNPARGSVNFNNSLTSRDTFSFAGDATHNPVPPVVGQPVLLTDTVLGDLFGGSISEVVKTQVAGNFTFNHSCQCVSWDSLASRRGTGQPNDLSGNPSNAKFSGMAAGGVFQWIATHGIGSDMSTVSVVTGPTIPEITFDYVAVSDAFDQICAAASSDVATYIWRTDARRNLFFELQSTSPAPWNISDTDALVGFTTTRTDEKYVNVATVTPKNSTGSTIDSNLVVTYQNNPAIDERAGVEGGTGRHEAIIAAGDNNSSMDALTLATSIAKTYGVMPEIVEYSTYRGGLRSGHLQTIVLTALGISGSYLIDSVTMSTANGKPLWQIHAVSGALIGDWRAALANLANNSQGYASVSGGASNDFYTDPIVAGHVSPDLQKGMNHKFFLTGATAIIVDNPVFTGGVIALGTSLTLQVYQDATGSRPTPTFGALYAGTAGKAISTDPLSISTFYFRVDGSGNFGLIGFQAGTGAVAVVVTPPSLPTSVSASEHANERVMDGDRVASTPVYVTYVLPIGHGATSLHVWFSDGATKEDIGVFGIGDVIKFWRNPGNTDLTGCTVLVSTGKVGAENPPSSAVPSTPFSIGKIGVAPSTEVPAVTVVTGDGSNWPYNVVRADGTQYWKIPGITYDDSTAFAGKITFFARVTAQDLDSAKAPIGPEHEYFGQQVTGGVHTESLMGEYGTDGFSYTRTGNIAYVRIRVYSCNRVNQDSGAFSDPLTSVLQMGVGGGLGYSDTLVAVGGAIPPGAMDMGRTNHATWSPSFAFDATGKPKLNTDNLSNLLYNGGFENGQNAWSKMIGPEFGVESSPGFAYSGKNYWRTDGNVSNGGIAQGGTSCRPGDSFYAEAYINMLGGLTGQVTLWMVFSDAAGAQLGYPTANLSLNGITKWTKVSLTSTAPLWASVVTIFVQASGTLGGGPGWWYIDNVLLAKQPGTGAGTIPDGNGGLAIKTSPTIGTDGTGAVVIPPLSVQTSNLAAESLGDLTKYSSTVRAVTVVFGLPTLPNANYPSGAIIMSVSDGKVYRTSDGSTWNTKSSPQDLFTGNLAAGVVYAGTVAAANVVAGSLYGFTITGSTLSLVLGGTTTTINNSTDPNFTGVAGLVVRSTGSKSVVTDYSIGTRVSGTGQSVMLYAGAVYVGGNQVVGGRGVGPGNTTDSTDVALRFNLLLNQLRGHGLIT